MIKISPKGIDFGALIYIIWLSVNNVCGDNYFYLNLILFRPEPKFRVKNPSELSLNSIGKLM